jgi:1-phosphatidylinositol-3-phosphate 5-kinase
MDTLSRVARASSPPNNKVAIAGPSTSRAGKGKPAPRLGVGKEKATVGTRSTSIAPASRSTVRRSSFAPGSRVANLAKQYEKITKENERAARRYSVIRGRRARPVTSTRARVQVLDSVKDAIYDEVESSDSSEADSEDNNDADEDENDNAVEAPKQASVEAQAGIATNSEDVAADAQIPTTGTDKPESDVQEVAVPENVSQALVSKAPSPSVPSSPFLASLPGLRQQPPDLDLNGPSERNSILRALSGFWGQQPFQRGRMDVDGDDPMADPEHIFRDSSMVVRTDEPTSIIALALK